MEIEHSKAKALTPEEVQHLKKLKVVMAAALADGVLSEGEMAHIKSLIWADNQVTYEELRTVHETLKSLMEDELPLLYWRRN